MAMRGARLQRGQVLPTFAFCMIALIGFMGLAIDMGYLRLVKRKMQSAADSAAIAGALHLSGTGGVGYVAAAQAAAAADGYTDGTNGVTVSAGPGTTASHTGPAYVEVGISQPQPTFFMRIFGVNSAAMTARAVATVGNGARICVFSLNPTVDLTVTGDVDATSCGIIGNGNMTITGSITAGSIGVGGNYSGSVTITDPHPLTPQSGIAEVTDPLAYLSATQPTAGTCSTFPATNIVDPGTYCNINITGGTVTFNPGLYITTGGMNVTGNATVQGSGVTIYVDSGAISFATGTNVTLSAPAPGQSNAGILLWQNTADTSAASFLGDNSALGAFYFPNATVNFGNPNGTAQTIIVADIVKFQGSHIQPPSADLSPIKDAVLVE